MQTLEYWCDDCGWVGSRQVIDSNKDNQTCHHCGGPLLQGLPTRDTGFTLKHPNRFKDGNLPKKRK